MTAFKTAVMKKLSEIQDDSERPFNELRKKTEQRKYCTKKIETKHTKKNQLLEMNNSEMRNVLGSNGNRTDQTSDRLSELKIETQEWPRRKSFKK